MISGLDPTLGFILFLAATLALLGSAVLMGMRARRHAHVKLVAATLVSLAVTIYFAERLGELYDLETAGRITPIHLALAKTTVVAYLLPIVTGVLTWRDISRKRLHRIFAWSVIALTVATAATGIMMVVWSERL